MPCLVFCLALLQNCQQSYLTNHTALKDASLNMLFRVEVECCY